MKLKYTINGIDCPNCAAKLASLMEAEAGITSAKINFLTERLTVETELEENECLELIRKTAKKFSGGITVEK
jgi:Cd2+/Zn2+-exporting ATPase